MSRSPRVVIEVRWSKAEKVWTIKRQDGYGAVLAYVEEKKAAVRRGAQEARAWRQKTGERVELVLFRKDGRIATGHDARRSYGADPRRIPG